MISVVLGGKANSAYNGPKLLLKWTTLILVRFCPISVYYNSKNSNFHGAWIIVVFM